MYKLFLCLRYLWRRPIAILPMIGMTLCVAMVLIAVSVFDGFLNKIERAAKGLFGDIVMEADLSGIGYYDEFIAELTNNPKVPEVEAASPFIYTMGMVRFGTFPGARATAQVAGIRLPERAMATDFANGLHFEQGLPQPTFSPSWKHIRAKLLDEIEYTQSVIEQERKDQQGHDASPEKQMFLENLGAALHYQKSAVKQIDTQDRSRAELEEIRKSLEKMEADPASSELDKKDLRSKERETEKGLFSAADHNAVVGLGVAGFTLRTDRGQSVRLLVPGQKVILTLIPTGRGLSAADSTPNTSSFTIIDDSRRDVYSIDSDTIYLPLETLQKLNYMDAEYGEDRDGKPFLIRPARVSQILIKVRDLNITEERLADVARRVDDLWQSFCDRHPEATQGRLTVKTWRERQARLIAPIQAQRTLVAIMFGIMSVVAIVLVFAIFYMIVVQKTKDIGVIKSIGGSHGGVAALFLGYGAAVGLVGAVVGTLVGWVFVLNINPIHDWVGRTFGFVVFSKESFMFEKIPSEVQPLTAGVIVVVAMISGLLGALVPALKAARMQPVEALRYE